MTADLSALIARLEAAEVGSRELDEAISTALCDAKFRTCIDGLPDEEGGMWMYEFDGHAPSSAPRLTESLDAALALADRVFPGWDWIVGRTNGGLTIHCQFGDKDYVFGNTPALALCIAVLKAKQGEKE